MSKNWKSLREKAAMMRDAVAANRAKLGKIGYYAAVAALVAALGSATYAWRAQGNVPQRAETQRAAMAMRAATPTAEPEPAFTPEPARFVWPLDGEIVGEFAPDRLVWSASLGQWQTHPGIDLQGSPGEAVRACADGVVEDVWQDRLWGNVIVVVHDEGYVSTYAGLNTLNLVEPGQRVTGGEIISAVGESAACEASLPWHVHFELTKDGQPVDFASLAPKN